MLKACWLWLVILKKICGIKQAEDRVTWPNVLHRHTSMLASFREWSVVSAWLPVASLGVLTRPRPVSSTLNTWVNTSTQSYFDFCFSATCPHVKPQLIQLIADSDNNSSCLVPWVSLCPSEDGRRSPPTLRRSLLPVPNRQHPEWVTGWPGDSVATSVVLNWQQQGYRRPGWRFQLSGHLLENQ